MPVRVGSCAEMTCWRQQALIDSPIDVVWDLVRDPERYPEWASDVVEVTGLPTIAEGATFTQKTRLIGTATTTYVIDTLEEDLRRIRLRCTKSGYYSDWALTEAQGETFADVEIGMEPTTLPFRAIDATVGKRMYRKLLEQTLVTLRQRAAERAAARSR